MAVVPVLARSSPLPGPVPPPLLACLGRGRPGLGSVPPCSGTRRGSRLGLLPLAPGHLAGGLLQLIHPLPGRREERGADEHHARKPQKTTDPDQHPSPDQQAAVDLHALRRMRCCSSASFLSPIGGRLHRRPRRQQTPSTAPQTAQQTVQHRPPSLVPVRVILGCGWMLVRITLEQRVVGVVGLEAADSRIRIPSSKAPGAWLGHKPGTPRDNSGPRRTVVIWP